MDRRLQRYGLLRRDHILLGIGSSSAFRELDFQLTTFELTLVDKKLD